MSHSDSASTPPPARIVMTKEEWRRLNPFLSEQQAEGYVRNPQVRRPPPGPFHDYPDELDNPSS